MAKLFVIHLIRVYVFLYFCVSLRVHVLSVLWKWMCSLRWRSSSWSMHCRTSNTNHRWVAHIKEASRQTAPREADLPQDLAGRKSGLSALPHPADVCLPCGSPSGLPTNCGTPFSTLPESLTSLTVHLPAHLPILHSHGNKRILMGTWWEQKDIDGLLKGTRRI
jgi:hypothetical protein